MKFIIFLILFLPLCVSKSWSLCKLYDSKKCASREKFLKQIRKGCARESSQCRYQFCSANCLTSKSIEKDKTFCLEQCGSTETLARSTSDERRIFYGTILQDPQKIFLTESRVYGYKTKRKQLTEEDTELYKSLVLGSSSLDPLRTSRPVRR